MVVILGGASGQEMEGGEGESEHQGPSTQQGQEEQRNEQQQHVSDLLGGEHDLDSIQRVAYHVPNYLGPGLTQVAVV